MAAYKAAEVVRALRESGIDIVVVPTEASLNFVGAATWEALSGNPVATGVWSDISQVNHVRLGQQADLVLVAPATADLLARASHGLADDLLTNVLLTARCPVMMAPAMHTEMWNHAATQANVAVLRARGVIVLEPAVGRLTGTDSGAGRLPEPRAIADATLDALRRPPTRDLAGLRIVVSTGGTRESWDPVRFLGNRSSGRQGAELARTAISRGAQVTVVAASIDVDLPAGAHIVRVESAADMHTRMLELAADADVVVMAAAVADFRPEPAASKVKKTGSDGVTLRLEQTVDVLADLVAHRTAVTPFIVGFAAETAQDQADLLELGRAKFQRKGCDLLVVNEVGSEDVFGSGENGVTILGRDEDGDAIVVSETSRQSKAAIADSIWDAVLHQADLRTAEPHQEGAAWPS